MTDTDLLTVDNVEMFKAVLESARAMACALTCDTYELYEAKDEELRERQMAHVLSVNGNRPQPRTMSRQEARMIFVGCLEILTDHMAKYQPPESHT